MTNIKKKNQIKKIKIIEFVHTKDNPMCVCMCFILYNNKSIKNIY